MYGNWPPRFSKSALTFSKFGTNVGGDRLGAVRAAARDVVEFENDHRLGGGLGGNLLRMGRSTCAEADERGGCRQKHKAAQHGELLPSLNDR
jgi:hypothetical protein